MRKPSNRKIAKKVRKDNFDEKFEHLVGEYQTAKAVLDTLEEDSVEYGQQKKQCDMLFANAERFFHSRQK
ncbi:hypothetical protein [Shewanella litorisediminis]|uniref:Uncharacterized protein n=1 Tax=Shewanella litorisediminis TaxID=1173586 RepID=A0ABX7G596_9GAMM|nr:hypothetical protein [Shewanella litorisediminis]MCL2920211.1 hypothetical protein [Shewanella litorisediminis]QRH02496.1 hypothetical protein JQC75_03470 [Shewanella litorisediminis]